MNSPDAETLSKRIELHLRRNQFAICKGIIEGVEKEYRRGNSTKITAIAELDIAIGAVTLLEKKGYIHIKQFDDVDIVKVCSAIRHIGHEEALRVSKAVEKAHKHNLRLQRTAIREELNSV